MKVAAVVVTYNRLNLLTECLEAIRNQTRKVEEIIVVNNGSTDGTAGWLANQHDLTIITQENLGGAGGFYAGMKTAYEKGHDWIWFMDDDGEPKVDALEKSSDFFNCAGIAGLASLEVDLGGLVQQQSRGYFQFENVFKGIVKPMEISELNTGRAIEIEHASFVGVLFSRSAISQVGYVNRDFFIHLDDVEYCVRLRRAGKLLLIPQSVIVHKEASGKNKRTKALFYARPEVYPFDKLWLYYYPMRNLVYLGKRYSPNRGKFYFQMMTTLIRKIVAISLLDDKKLKRINLVITAFLDGLNGTFDNEKPKRILYKKSVNGVG